MVLILLKIKKIHFISVKDQSRTTIIIIDSHLIQLIVCPHCLATLCEDDNKLTCSEFNRTYPIRRSIPGATQTGGKCNI